MPVPVSCVLVCWRRADRGFSTLDEDRHDPHLKGSVVRLRHNHEGAPLSPVPKPSYLNPVDVCRLSPLSTRSVAVTVAADVTDVTLFVCIFVRVFAFELRLSICQSPMPHLPLPFAVNLPTHALALALALAQPSLPALLSRGGIRFGLSASLLPWLLGQLSHTQQPVAATPVRAMSVSVKHFVFSVWRNGRVA